MSDLVPLGKTKVTVSALGVGSNTWGAGNKNYGGSGGPDEEVKALDTCLANGINFFDTAEMYGMGASEVSLGVAAKGKDVRIATKFLPWWPTKPFRTSGSLPKALKQSLGRLGRERIELYQVHFPVFWMSIPKLMDRMAQAVDYGEIRAVGVSNYSEAQMRLAHRVLAEKGIPLASNQVQYSLLHRDPEQDGVLAACRELGITLIAYMPLASGALTGKYSKDNLPADSRRRNKLPQFRKKNMERVESLVSLLRDIGEDHERSPTQVALRWLMQQEAVLPIPGIKNSTQAKEVAGALTFTLNADEVEELSEESIDKSKETTAAEAKRLEADEQPE
jgi:aryl-alcohol dehydrogenase-like predicted oxidoreductase